jgi:hypothetical protein
MVDTWHGSWFEEGTRLLYVMRPPRDGIPIRAGNRREGTPLVNRELCASFWPEAGGTAAHKLPATNTRAAARRHFNMTTSHEEHEPLKNTE